MADKKSKNKSSKANGPSIKVTTGKPQPLGVDEKLSEKPRMKAGTEPPGTGLGGVAPPEETKWKPGASANPGGRPKDPPGMKEVRLLTKHELVRVGNSIIFLTADDLKEMAENDDASALQIMIASVVARIIRTGDMNMLNTLLDRLVGKVKEEFAGSLNHSGQVSVGGRTLVALPSNGREVKK